MAVIVRAVDGVSGIPVGFPILLNNKMAIIESAFTFLLELATVPGRSHSPETLRTYAEHLHDWFDSLEQSDLDWRTVDEATIAAYRNRMLSAPSPHTGRSYARSTINDRVGTVCRFYVWAQRRRLIAELPFGYVDVSVRPSRPQRMLTHLDRRPAIMSGNGQWGAVSSLRKRLLRPCALVRGARGVGLVTPVGLRPPCVTSPPASSHPD